MKVLDFMPTIQQDGAYTLAIEFETEPATVEEMIEGIAAVVERSFAPDPRFVSASFHVSEDGRRVLNYAQWTSRADYEAFMDEAPSEANEAIGEAIRRGGARPLAGHAYAVRRVVER